jgi:hypothetical protein
MSEWYILDDKKRVVPAADYGEFFAWRDAEAAKRGQDKPTATLQVAKDEIDGHTVSTIFLGLDHGWGEKQPIVFETMTFGDPYEQNCWRYATWDEAVAGHDAIVAALREGRELPE